MNLIVPVPIPVGWGYRRVSWYDIKLSDGVEIWGSVEYSFIAIAARSECEHLIWSYL